MLPGIGSTRRWTAQRKAILIMAVEAGFFSRDEGCARFGIPAEEFAEWQTLYNTHGVDGLKSLLEAQCLTELPEVDEELLPEFTLFDLHFSRTERTVAGTLGEVYFEPTPWDILMYLVQSQGKVCSKYNLYDYLYKGSSKKPLVKIIDVYVCKIRRLLENTTPENYIETVWGRGWQFRK